MSDLIRRKDAIDAAITFVVEYCGAAFDEDMQKMLCERLNTLPSTKLEREKGQWIIRYFDMETYEDKEKVYNYYEKMPEGDVYCSECKESALLNGHEESVFSNFCPHCGADMRGEYEYV